MLSLTIEVKGCIGQDRNEILWNKLLIYIFEKYVTAY